jgi:hypothetical protein
MPFCKAYCRALARELLALLVALVVGGGAFLLAVMLLPDEESGSEGYAVLSVDAEYPDREIGNRIAAAANTYISADYSSESTQWVFLSDFETILRLSIDEYDARLSAIAPFHDPRDDGYAARLRAFFVQEGRRLFFIPFVRPALREEVVSRLRYQSHSGNRELETALTKTFADIPFSLEWLGYDRKPLWLYFGIVDALCVFAILLTRGALLVCAPLPAPIVAAQNVTTQSAVFLVVCLLVAIVLATVRVLPSLEETMLLYHAPQEFACERIDEAEYLAHVGFQTSFMARTLPRTLYPLNTKAYLRYDNGADGLVSETEVPAGVMTVDAPPFPLKKLMGFLAGTD